MADCARELDYDGLMNLAKAKAEAKAIQMYPDPNSELRKEAVREWTLKYFRQMYSPER